MDPRWVLILGWTALYVGILWRGQSLPESVELERSWLLPGRKIAVPVEREALPDWNVWLDWKDNFMALAGLLTVYLAFGRIAGRSKRFRLAFGLAYVVVLHGVGGALLLLLLAVANFAMALWLRRTVGRPGVSMLVSWLANLSALVAMFWLTADLGPGHGIRIQSIAHKWVWLRGLNFQGCGPWHSYRFTCLRFISFACDSFMAAAPSRTCSSGQASDLMTFITAAPRPTEEYSKSLGLYLAYVTYPPLYFAGPFLSYNAFAGQQEKPAFRHSNSDIAKLALSVLGYSCTLELLQHVFWYSGWVGSQAPLATLLTMPGLEIVAAVHVLVNFEWMSLLVVWRFNRVIALLDGIDTFENMTLNIDYICSFQDLWRHWHVSLNKFCVRYLYVPLGGSKRPLLGVLATFLFVALWHEVHGAGTAFHWYSWGALNCVGVLVEKLFLGFAPKNSWYSGAMGAATQLAMQWANLPALMEWDASQALGLRILAGWALGLPVVLFGLQRVVGDLEKNKASKVAGDCPAENLSMRS